MPDILKNKTGYPKHRYSINELIELSATAYIPFDLSKFTYDAARAGVIPSLGDCAITSRKSSAGSGRRHEIETVAAKDLVAIQGNTRAGPNREPYLPPPMERQKDEGFAKFLKKHSSPTHNRVTAGGRIVPMEPRSPPTFTLPSNAVSASQEIADDQDFLDAQQNGKRDWNNKLQRGLDYNIPAISPLFGPSPVQGAAFQGGASANTNPIPAMHGATVCGSPPNIQPCFNASNLSMPPIAFGQSYGAVQESGDVAMPPGSYNAQFGLNNYTHYYNPTQSTDIPYAGDYIAAHAWESYNQSLGQQLYDFQSPSTQQQLAAWQQHYADLDLQLKNIDRHRAMHQLDPYLAEQRRVIVQQRSDAKDTIQEYQGMLGLKRMTDSSQESFTTAFNIDAPVYVPAKEFNKTGRFTCHDLAATIPEKQVTSVIQSSTGRKAIPIRPPPPNENGKPNSSITKLTDSERQGLTHSEDWRSKKQNTLYSVKQEQKAPVPINSNDFGLHLQQPNNKMLRKDDVGVYESRPVTDCGKTESFEETPTAVIPKIEQDQTALTNASFASNPGHGLQQIVDAISRPKGVITQIRLLDNRVVDVEGQDLQLDASPLPDGTWTHYHQTSHGSVQSATQDNRRLAPKVSSSFDEGGIVNEIANKENISVTPMYHQKAATDAFLSQFNVIDDSMALAVKSETQSLRPASNRQSDSQGYKVQDFYQPQTGLRINLSQVQSLRSSDQNQSAIAPVNNDSAITVGPMNTEDFNHKGYSSVGIQNIHAVGRLPHNFDGSMDAQQSAHARLSNAKKAKSPRLLRRHGMNGGAWYGPHCREVFERALSQNKITSSKT